jgi:hypothetical protein
VGKSVGSDEVCLVKRCWVGTSRVVFGEREVSGD